MTHTEPEWDDEQQGLILALAEIEADQCPNCGGVLSETTSKDVFEYVGDGVPIECKRCTGLAGVRERYEHDHPKAVMSGLFFPVHPRT